MSDSYLKNLASIYDKTNLKGIYLFLSFAIISYVFYLYGIITDEIIIDPTKSIGEYIILLSFVSLTAAFLFFLKIENVILRLYLRLSGHTNNFHRFRNVNYQDSFNSIFISKQRKEFISLLFFWISLMLLLLLSVEITLSNSTSYYKIILIIFLIIIIGFDIINTNFKLPLHVHGGIIRFRENLKKSQKEFSKIRRRLRVEKDEKKQEDLKRSIKKLNRKIQIYKGLDKFFDLITPIINHLSLTLTLVLLFIFLLIIPISPLSLFIIIFQYLFLIALSLKWKKLQIQLKLVYFMRLFLQEGKYRERNYNKNVGLFINNIKENHWEEAKFNFNLFLKSNFDPILKHKSIQRVTIMNNLQKMFDCFIECKKTGTLRNTDPEENNKIKQHYNNICFKLFNHLINMYNSLDDWFKSFIRLGGYPLPNYQLFFEIMRKIEKFNSDLTSEEAGNMSMIDFIIALCDEYRDYDTTNLEIFDINGHYYFESAKKTFDRIESLVKNLNLLLNIKSTDRIDYFRSKKERKIVKYVQKENELIIDMINDLKSQGQLEEFLSANFNEDYWKLESELKLFKEDSIPDLLFIESCSKLLGKKFIKTIKRKHNKKN